ncbi:YjiH family protein [Salsuginibacillus kocurii]|uniref:YjiH family protein n=1 Tax=Salsuginibacillus kocurii TaxID=427078 RepID=UPI0003648742|nr:YjiH family protein [Salsuginibacillus kocurii]
MDSRQQSGNTASLKFIVLSLLGVFLFMVPINIEGDLTIPVALLAEMLGGFLAPILPELVTLTIFVSVAGSILVKVFPSFSEKAKNSETIQSLFVVSPFWLAVRLIGLIFAVLVLFEVGPEAVIAEFTGGLMLHDLLTLLFTIFLFAGLFLPLLLNFGLLELFGTLLNPIMRPLFKLPGRSSIDSLTSWLGDGTIGVLLTNQQYEQGFYTKREAAVIGTTFSVVSITFSIYILTTLELTHLVIPYYLTIVLAGFVAALIMPRIPPLSLKEDTYYEEAPETQVSEVENSQSALKAGWTMALKRASQSRVSFVFTGGVKNVLGMWLGVLPIVMAFGTAAVIVAEFTPFFSIIGAPFIPLLQLMNVPEASAAAETMLIGFADMLLPAIIGGDIESEMTRFIIGCLSVSQLIYLSEVGGVLLASKLPVRFIDLVIIFLQRTIITLPVIVLVAHMIF